MKGCVILIVFCSLLKGAYAQDSEEDPHFLIGFYLGTRVYVNTLTDKEESVVAPSSSGFELGINSWAKSARTLSN